MPFDLDLTFNRKEINKTVNSILENSFNINENSYYHFRLNMLLDVKLFNFVESEWISYIKLPA